MAHCADLFGCWHSHLVWRDDSCSQTLATPKDVHLSTAFLFSVVTFPSTLNAKNKAVKTTYRNFTHYGKVFTKHFTALVKYLEVESEWY